MASSQPNYIAVATNGGDYPWTWPKVTLASAVGDRPNVAAGDGPDPHTGSGIYPVHSGTGPLVSKPDTARIHYIHQSWDAATVQHDSWHDPGTSEIAPDSVLGARINLVLQRAHVGDVYEIVVSADSAAAVEGKTAIIVVQVDTAS